MNLYIIFCPWLDSTGRRYSSALKIYAYGKLCKRKATKIITKWYARQIKRTVDKTIVRNLLKNWTVFPDIYAMSASQRENILKEVDNVSRECSGTQDKEVTTS